MALAMVCFPEARIICCGNGYFITLRIGAEGRGATPIRSIRSRGDLERGRKGNYNAGVADIAIDVSVYVCHAEREFFVVV